MRRETKPPRRTPELAVTVLPSRGIRRRTWSGSTWRRVGGGTLIVSKVALFAFLDGDDDALVSYRDHGVRASYPPLVRYYERADLGHLLALPEFCG